MDTALKQRLVGASVLIALAVVVLPMMLGGRPEGDSQETQKIELPTQPPELDFQTRRYPIGEKAPVRDSSIEPAPVKALPTPGPASDAELRNTQASSAATSSAEPGQEDTLQDPLEASADADVSADEAPGTEGQAAVEDQLASAATDAPTNVDIAPLAAPSASTEEGGRYVLQVASFGAIDNANRLAATLREQGYGVLLDSVTSDLGVLHRVRVGPYETETQANEAVSALQAQDKNTKPRVVDLQPQSDAAVTQPSDPLVRWVVQVGSFSDASNADNLVARLRLESMSAYKEEISRSGSVVYRVRVGPFMQREDAIKADQSIRQRLSIDGVVMSAD